MACVVAVGWRQERELARALSLPLLGLLGLPCINEGKGGNNCYRLEVVMYKGLSIHYSLNYEVCGEEMCIHCDLRCEEVGRRI